MNMNEWTLFNDSVSARPETEEIPVLSDNGMQGEAMPYKPVSDSNAMFVIISAFLLIVIAMQNEKGKVSAILRNRLSTSSARTNIFDDGYNTTSNISTVLLCGVSCIMGGFFVYHYYSYSDPDFFSSTRHPVMLGIYTGALMSYLTIKWLTYSFINWIFFEKEKSRLWIEDVFNIIAVLGFIFFLAALYIVFLDSEFNFSTEIILIIIFISKLLLFYKCFRHFFSGSHGILHLILYFCALEIVPDLFLWKGIELINSILY